MAVFANIIDISALNALVIFKEINPNWQTSQKTTIRRNFLRELGLSLSRPYMASRTGKPRSSSTMNLHEMASSSHVSKRSKSVPLQTKGRQRCLMCCESNSASKNNMHTTICCFCLKGACKSTHNRNVCVKCIENKLI